jgi:pyruvate/2-oxoglutarate dehydrogenase complex dihydrolipoamide acyltransferase (E2) component
MRDEGPSHRLLEGIRLLDLSRISDGAMGAKFLQKVKKIRENPVQLLL